MSDALILREHIFNTLISQLGTYTFIDEFGAVIGNAPALALIEGNGELYPPDGTRIEGLEVVIFFPAYSPKPLIQGYKVRQEWIVHLKQWTVGEGVQAALDSLLSPGIPDFLINQINEVPADYKIGIPAGAQVKFNHFVFT